MNATETDFDDGIWMELADILLSIYAMNTGKVFTRAG
jgi:hypothetical protein